MNVHRDCAYAAASPAQRLDLYVPRGPGPHPAVLWIHGGGWMTESRALAVGAPQLRALSRGMALASVGYRLSGEARFPAQVHDVKAAVRWLRAHGPAYGLDGGRIAAWGASAGGHLAALLGTSTGVEDLEGAAPGMATEPSGVSAVVDWYGPTDFLAMDAQTVAMGCPVFGGSGHDGADSPESRLMGFPIQERPDRTRRADPAGYVHPGVPPFLVQHGTRDCTVPAAQGRWLADRIAVVAGPDRVMFDTLDAGHGGRAFDDDANVDRVLDFLLRHID